jgi:hypothetical protein
MSDWNINTLDLIPHWEYHTITVEYLPTAQTPEEADEILDRMGHG